MQLVTLRLGDKESMGGIPGVQRAPSVGHVLNEMFEATVETKLRQPTFVMDHPTEISPLVRGCIAVLKVVDIGFGKAPGCNPWSFHDP
jgi:lysyl-tRNA synthetase class II